MRNLSSFHEVAEWVHGRVILRRAAPRTDGAGSHTPWGVSTEQGPRRWNADATAFYRDPASGRVAWAVADGVGDTPDAACAARVVADHAVRVGVFDGARSAITASRDLLRACAPNSSTDAAVVVAASVLDRRTRTFSWTVAWVGDCRAYCCEAQDVRLLAVDQTVAQGLRARGIDAASRWEHVLTNSVRTTEDEDVGGAVAPPTGRLVLMSDGVHKALPSTDIDRILSRPTRPSSVASLLTAAAGRAGTTDNATAVVVDLGGAERDGAAQESEAELRSTA